MAADAAKSAKERAISWNKGDDIKLFELFNKDIANPSATDKHYLEDIREKHFTHILYRNFRTNYLKKSAQWEVDRAKKGANHPRKCHIRPHCFLRLCDRGTVFAKHIPRKRPKHNAAAGEDADEYYEDANEYYEDANDYYDGDGSDNIDYMAKTNKAPQGKPPKHTAPPAVDTASLTQKFAKVKVKDSNNKGRCFSFDCTNPYVYKAYCKNKVDKLELEFLTFPFPKDYFKISLEKGGTEVHLWIATPEHFGETKRMKAQIGRAKYKTNDPRAIAQEDAVQEIRGQSKAVNKKFWGEKPQIVELPVKCEGVPGKAWTMHKITEVAGQDQYAQIITLIYKVAKQRVAREKEGRTSICEEISDDEESDIDRDDDASDEDAGGGEGARDDDDMD